MSEEDDNEVVPQYPIFQTGVSEVLADGTELLSVRVSFGEHGDQLRYLGRIWENRGYGWVAAPASTGRADSWAAEVQRATRSFENERDACMFLYGHISGVGYVKFQQALATMPWMRNASSAS